MGGRPRSVPIAPAVVLVLLAAAPGAPASPSPAEPPGPPRDVLAEPGTGLGEIRLSWRAPVVEGDAPVASYRIHRGLSDASFETRHVVPASRTSFVDWNVSLARRYYYVVTAVGAAGESVHSNVACSAPSPGALAWAGPPCPLPPGWREAQLASERVRVAVPGARLLVVEARAHDADPRFADVTVVVGGDGSQPVAIAKRVYAAGLVHGTLRHEAWTPEVESPFTVSLDVRFRYDPARGACALRVDGACHAPTFLDPFDLQEFAGPGSQGAVVVDAKAEADGREVARVSLVVSHAGQAIGGPE